MNFGSLLGGLAGGALAGYGMGGDFGGVLGKPNNGSFLLPQGDATQGMNQIPSAGLGGILPGASVPLQTGAQGSAFGGLGQGLTNASAGLFQPNVSQPVGGNQMNPLVRALLMGR